MKEGSKEDQAAIKIQNIFNCHINRRIFNVLSNLIKNNNTTAISTNPKHLLKTINPSEMQYANCDDKSNLSIHIRFRLGGSKFPPKIYYKLYFSKKASICDIGR